MIVCVKDIDFWKAFRPIKISLDKSNPEGQLCKKLHFNPFTHTTHYKCPQNMVKGNGLGRINS